MPMFFQSLGTSESEGGKSPYRVNFVFTNDTNTDTDAVEKSEERSIPGPKLNGSSMLSDWMLVNLVVGYYG